MVFILRTEESTFSICRCCISNRKGASDSCSAITIIIKKAIFIATILLKTLLSKWEKNSFTLKVLVFYYFFLQLFTFIEAFNLLGVGVVINLIRGDM